MINKNIYKHIVENTIAGHIEKNVAAELLNMLHNNLKTGEKDIAIIGISSIMPQADGVKEFWRTIRNGTDCVRDLPEGRRKDIDDYLKYTNQKSDDLVYPNYAYLNEIHNFDYSFFGISPKEASLMDPNQRLFLQTVWSAIEDSGYGGNKLVETKTGVYVGYNSMFNTQYAKMIRNVEPDAITSAVTGNIPEIIASRISYILDLKGPSMLINTACSSSLVAVHLACQAIRNNECDMAIAGSVKLKILPFDDKVTIGIEASDGRTRTFDDNSDGTGGGEGVVAIILKPLDKAIKDRDHIYAVIKGSAINQDGKSAGLTAPNPFAQEELIVRAWKDADINPEKISYIEAHGTGTRLGDPIEIEGITRAFRRYTDRKQFCAIGSVKSNIGHLDNAAGMAGLLKAILALKKKEIPASLHLKRPNRNIEFEESPVYYNNRLSKWDTKGEPLRCGVSSFGLSGTNCHIILEEAPFIEEQVEEKHELSSNSLDILTISARSKGALKELVALYSSYISEIESGSIKDICYTSNTGRGHYEYRMAIIVSDKAQLKEALERVLSVEDFNSYQCNGIYIGYHELVEQRQKTRGNFDITNEEITRLTAKAEALIDRIQEAAAPSLLEELCCFYINGANVNWGSLYTKDGNNRRLLSLPTYPFEKKRCWIDIPVNKTIEIYGRDNDNYSDTERKMAQVWGEVLGFERINVYEDFFKLGGDSLIAIRIVNYIKKHLNLNVTVEGILKFSSIEELSKHIDECQRIEASSHHPIQKVTQKEYYPLSSAQQRMFILNQIESSKTNYNIPAVMTIEGKVSEENIVTFTQVFHKLIKRHEGLRTSFLFVDGKPVQRIHPEVEFGINRIDESNSRDDRRDVEDIVHQLIQTFDLSLAPLFAVSLVKLNDNRSLLVFDIHHIIADGTSMKILVKEFIDLSNGRSLTDLNIQYKDYAIWQRDRQECEELRNQKKFWLKKFSEDIPVLNMPIDYARPYVQSFTGDKISFFITEEQKNEINQFAIKTGTTTYIVLMGILYVLLYRYTNQEDIIIGTPVEGRTHADLEHIVGMFVNTLAMRNYPTGSKTFLEFLLEVKNNMMEAYSNQEYQYEDLVNCVCKDRDISRNPLVDIVFNYITSGAQRIEIDGLLIEPYDYNNKKSIFDITMTAVEGGAGIRFDIEYTTALYKEETIVRIKNHFQNIIRDVLSQPEKKLMDIELMSSEEKSMLLYGLNNTIANYPKNQTLQEIFEQQVKRNSDRVSIEFCDASLTYEQLNRRANQLAHSLRELGVGRECIVGLMVERSLEMIVGIMAILKAGGAYLPIDPSYPEDRIKYMIENSGTNIILTQKQFVDQLKGFKQVIDITSEAMYEKDDSNPTNTNIPGDLAYIIYTSGTTGRPKGVMIEHKNVVRLLFNDRFQFDFNHNDVWTMFHSYCFDFSVWEIFGALLYGGKLLIVPKMTAMNTVEFRNLLEDKEVTVLNQTPTAFYNLLTEDNKNRNRRLDSVRYVIFGGEALKPSMLSSWKEKYPQMKLINMYGITETTVHVTYREITDYEIKNNISDIGTPIPTLSVYLMDKNMKLCPIGVSGEIFVGGDGVGRGYLHNPELTKQKFIENPYKKGEILYRSGDLARLLSNGTMEYLGRLDHQVKIRGYRIELGEIEYHLEQHQSVKKAVVVEKSNQSSKYLCAYLVMEKEISAQEFQQFLLKKLPSYMIPARYVSLASIPLTSNGKVNTQQLPEPDCSASTIGDNKVATNETQLKLIHIWKEVLQVDDIDIESNFFEIGGDSITLIQVHNRISSNITDKITVTDLFAYPTIVSLSEVIDQINIDNEKTFKEIELQGLTLPEEYFIAGEEKQEETTFEYRFDHSYCAMLKDISVEESIDIKDILLSMFLLLLKETTNEKVIAINTICEEPNILTAIKLDLVDLEDYTSLFQKLLISKEKGEAYKYKEQGNTRVIRQKDNKHKVTILFCEDTCVAKEAELLSNFDILLKVTLMEDQIILSCEYNRHKLVGRRVKNMFQSFIKLIRLMLTQY